MFSISFLLILKNTYTTGNTLTGSFCTGGNLLTHETSFGRGECSQGCCCCSCGSEYNHGRCPGDCKFNCNCNRECDGGGRSECCGGDGGGSFRCGGSSWTRVKSNCLTNFRGAESEAVSLGSIFSEQWSETELSNGTILNPPFRVALTNVRKWAWPRSDEGKGRGLRIHKFSCVMNCKRHAKGVKRHLSFKRRRVSEFDEMKTEFTVLSPEKGSSEEDYGSASYFSLSRFWKLNWVSWKVWLEDRDFLGELEVAYIRWIVKR